MFFIVIWDRRNKADFYEYAWTRPVPSYTPNPSEVVILYVLRITAQISKRSRYLYINFILRNLYVSEINERKLRLDYDVSFGKLNIHNVRNHVKDLVLTSQLDDPTTSLMAYLAYTRGEKHSFRLEELNARFAKTTRCTEQRSTFGNAITLLGM